MNSNDNEILKKKMVEEYINYIHVVLELKNLDYISNYKLKFRFHEFLQPLLEERILYRYSINKPPYHGFNPIEEEEKPLFDAFFKETKKYMEKHEKKNDFYYNLENIKESFYYLVNKKEKLFSDIYNKNNKVTVTKNSVTYKNLKIHLDERLKFILKKIKKYNFMILIFRYLGYGLSAHHCSLPINVYKYFYDNLNIRGEGFCSPLNSKLLNMKNTIFCTLFKDTDKLLGSKGPFSYKTLLKYSDINWTVNPPYIRSLIDDSIKILLKVVKKTKNKDFLAIVLIPKWEDCIGYNKLLKSKYLVGLLEPKNGEHYMNCNGIINKMDGVINSIFFISKNSKTVTENNINDIKKIWNTYEEDKINQSNFVKPFFV